MKLKFSAETLVPTSKTANRTETYVFDPFSLSIGGAWRTEVNGETINPVLWCGRVQTAEERKAGIRGTGAATYSMRVTKEFPNGDPSLPSIRSVYINGKGKPGNGRRVDERDIHSDAIKLHLNVVRETFKDAESREYVLGLIAAQSDARPAFVKRMKWTDITK